MDLGTKKELWEEIWEILTFSTFDGQRQPARNTDGVLQVGEREKEERREKRKSEKIQGIYTKCQMVSFSV